VRHAGCPSPLGDGARGPHVRLSVEGVTVVLLLVLTRSFPPTLGRGDGRP